MLAGVLQIFAFLEVLKCCGATAPPNSRKGLLLDTLRKAQIDPNRLAVDADDAFSKALNDLMKDNAGAPIDLLSVIRLQCRVEHNESGGSRSALEMQGECAAEMFDLTQRANIAPPNVTLAFGSDPYAKNRDFVAWCLRLLTSSYFEDEENLEKFRQEMILENPFWKAAVKATYLSAMEQDDVQNFEELIQEPKLWAEAVRKLKRAK
ncbi:hypothetical protein IV203_012365 [Nitzschia inconspicua]|uniref:Uncharacterized protein n=1 Tax=Nitzschia inconspicua TaxID=303405 RepID=A0A9K3PJQ5_9STRA|nr:hypothetical protein IV203_012365 [Nitzschia inconspicua]